MKNGNLRSAWPTAIVVYFVGFISCLVTFGIWVARQNVELVSRNYYAEEIQFQRRLDQMGRAKRVEEEIVVDHEDEAILVRFSTKNADLNPSGVIDFYRPSQASRDFTVPLALDSSGGQRIESRNLGAGLWKVRLRWTVGGEEFYVERRVILSAKEGK
jgi:nitrogen fixation protein FixH